MTIPTWAAAFADGISKIPAIFLNNYVRTQLPKCLDGVGGNEGVPSTPATKIQIYGAGLELGGSTPNLLYESDSVDHAQEALLYNVDTNTWGAGSITVAAGEQGSQSLRLPHGATLTAVTTYHDREDTGVPGATRVSLAVFRTDIKAGTVTQLGSTAFDTKAEPDYDAHHGFSVTALSEVVDRTKYVYHVFFSGENGAAAANTVWFGCTATITITKQDKAP